MAEQTQTQADAISEADAKKFAALLDSLGEEGALMATLYAPAAMVVTNEAHHGNAAVTHQEQVAVAARLAYTIGSAMDASLTEEAIYAKVVAVERNGGADAVQDYLKAHIAGASAHQLAEKQAAVVDLGTVEGIAQLGSEVLENSRKFYLTDIPPETYAAANPTDMEDGDYIAAIKQYRQYAFDKAQVTPDEVIAEMRDRPVPRREPPDENARSR